MTTSTKKENELNITRFYEASVADVWAAWTEIEQVKKWWGPRGFTLTSHSKELKPGGIWHYTMHGPDGVDYPNKTKYFEVEKEAKLVYDHGGYDDRPPLFRVTALFKAVKGGTLLDMTMAFESPEVAVEMGKFIKKVGGESTWDRLGEYLAKESSGKNIFVINRSFEVSNDTMYEMWTNPDHFSKWLAPTGFNMKFIKADIRAGGETRYSMSAENGSMTMYGRASYIKLEKPHTLIYTQQFCDEKGNTSRHPLAPLWPETMLTTVRLTEEAPTRTRVTVTWEPYGKATTEEVNMFLTMRGGMTQGWTGSFDKLENYLPQ